MPAVPKSSLLPKPIDQTKVPLAMFAEVGDIVNWYEGGDENRDAHAAMVTQFRDGRVVLNVFDAGLADSVPKDGVYHADHPLVSEGQRISMGTWRHRKSHEAMVAGMVKAGVLIFDGARLALPAPAKPPEEKKVTTPAA